MLFNEINDNFRKVLIKNIKNGKMLCIENKQIYFNSFDENKDISFIWFITIIDNEITFYSNGVYLGVSKLNNNIVGEKYMKRWAFEKINNRYKFYFENCKNYLTFEKNMAKVKVCETEDYQTFEMIDFYLLLYFILHQ